MNRQYVYKDMDPDHMVDIHLQHDRNRPISFSEHFHPMDIDMIVIDLMIDLEKMYKNKN